MCGIAGSIGPARPSEESVEATLASLRHRGPDGHGVHRDRIGDQQVTLLHTRLAIIDLSDRALQPYHFDDCVLSFNGEIYNYVELRRELEQAGFSFATGSDTEVLIKAYRHWGAACLDRLEGMWAFALLDRRQGTLLLSRDRFGEKPLYLWRTGGVLYFASEVKALAALAGRRPEVDVRQVRRYLVNGFRSLYKQPGSFFAGIEQLPPASFAVLSSPDLQTEKYWHLAASPRAMTLDQAVEGTRTRLRHALDIRLRADVPLAFCLSGGVDSSALASLAVKDLGRKIHTFSIIDEDQRYDESANVRATIADLACTHDLIPTSTRGFLDRLKMLVNQHDSPVATISYYVHSFLSEAIAAHGFKVALSGTAADEIFSGYYDHYSFWLAAMKERPQFAQLLTEWRASYGAFVQNPVLQDPLVFVRNPRERGHLYLNRELFNSFLIEPLEEDFTEEALADEPLRNRMLNELFHEIVPVILHEDDLNSMAWSIENRSPFLDRDLVEFLFSVPTEHLIQDGLPKALLRQAVKGALNEQVRTDTRKRGFNASIDSLLDRGDPRVMDRLLSPGPIYDVVKRDKVEAFLRADLHDNSFSKFAFSFVSAMSFLESDVVRRAPAGAA